LQAMLQSLDFTNDGLGTITAVDVQVYEAFHQHNYAGTTSSECRSPADDFYPVSTRIDIDFPIIPCTKEDFKDCILLDPITALGNTVDNDANQGIVQCSYNVDLHRKALDPVPMSPPPPAAPPPCDPTDGPIGSGFELSFSAEGDRPANMTYSNLGGLGPDSGKGPYVIYENVGESDGKQIDCVVSIAPGASTYEASDTTQTKINGKFAQINMLADRGTTLQFCFVEHDTESGTDAMDATQFQIPSFSLTFHDFDNAGSQMVERLTASGMVAWRTSTEMSDRFNPPIPTQLVVTESEGGGVTNVSFTSSEKGVGNDNAVDPDNLTDLQVSRMVQLFYHYQSCVTLDFAIILIGEDEPTGSVGEYTYGRNFLFSGGGGIRYSCLVNGTANSYQNNSYQNNTAAA